jgi:hypothetical protein
VVGGACYELRGILCVNSELNPELAQLLRLMRMLFLTLMLAAVWPMRSLSTKEKQHPQVKGETSAEQQTKAALFLMTEGLWTCVADKGANSKRW